MDFVSKEEIHNYQKEINNHFEAINQKNGKGNDFLGWVELPDELDENLLSKIENLANELRAKSEVFVVIGIGGSYLGARAVIEALSHHFTQLKGQKPFIIYAGHQISEEYMVDLLEILDQKDYSMTVISKSGTTTEPAIAFRILKNHIEFKVPTESLKRNGMRSFSGNTNK